MTTASPMRRISALLLHTVLVWLLLASCSGGGGGGGAGSEIDYDPAKGRFKLANSWTPGGSWENVPDGCLWITFDAMIAAQVPVFFFENREAYDPEYIVTFAIGHQARSDCEITAYLADSQGGTRVASKRFEDFSSRGGACPFPDNPMVMDITEFGSQINDYDLYMEVFDRGVGDGGGSDTGEITALSVERHDGYGTDPGDAIIATSTSLPLDTANGRSVFLHVDTATGRIGAPPPAGAPPGPGSRRRRGGRGGYRVKDLMSVTTMSSSDIEGMKRSWGVYRPGVNYNPIIHGHGTGLVPPTEEQWEDMKGNLRTVATLTARGRAIGYPESVDHSAGPYFPPIVSQGYLGSCACFAAAYFCKTFQEAREHGWDLSGAVWQDPWPGSPSTHQDRISSPGFVYNQINGGADGGTYLHDNIDVLCRLGAASWQTCPYVDADEYPPQGYDWPWGSEDAWREAPLYRGNTPDAGTWGSYYGIYVTNQTAVDLIKTVLANGMLLVIGVDAGLYDALDEDDVWTADTYVNPVMNHANTIVGYTHD